ncbi:MAG: TadG family pilus assembly protein [Methylohalobius sp. ZOD2]|nr:hypothetical protein [Methylothermaceae bacterium]
MKSIPRHQRGVIGIWGALTLGLAVLFTVLSVDTGRIMMEQRRLQKIADVAALDAASQTGACGDGTHAPAQAAAQASADRNDLGPDGTLEVMLGDILTNADGVRTFQATDPDIAMAVQVTAGNSVPASLVAGGIFGETVNLRASAVARRQALAGFSGGSLLASMNSEDSALLNALLGGVLGSNVNLELVSYNGIANIQKLTLADLVNATAGVGTVNELLDADLSLNQWLQIYADAVNASGVADATVIAATQTLANAAVSNLSANFGDILAVTAPNQEEAANASINLLDLITTTALVANGQNALSLPLNVSLPGELLNVQTTLEVIEPPQIVIGPPGRDEDGNWRTQMHTAQIRLLTPVQSTIDLNVAGLAGVRAEVDLALQLNVAQGSAWLEKIQCRRIGNGGSVATIGAQPGIASLNLVRAVDPTSPGARIDVSAILLLTRVSVATVMVNVDLPLQNSDSTQLQFEVDTFDEENILPMTQRASSGIGDSLGNALGSGDNLNIDVKLLGAISLPLLDTLIADALLGQLLAPLLNQLGTTTLDPLLRLLGIELGSLDVQLFELDVDQPALLI